MRNVDGTRGGDDVRGIDADTDDLGVQAKASPFTEHRWFLESPIPLSWLD